MNIVIKSLLRILWTLICVEINIFTVYVKDLGKTSNNDIEGPYNMNSDE